MAQLQAAQQQIMQKYAPQLAEAQNAVTIEAVMKLLRDDRTRSFTFEIESSSTILTDEIEEKASHNEFLGVFTKASEALMQMAALGEQGAELAGSLMRFTLAPYRAGRELEGAIQGFIDAAPAMAQKAAAQGQQGQQMQQAMAQAQTELAKAETMKAQAAMAKVQADAATQQAANQQKMADLQGKLQVENDKHARELQAVQAKSQTEMGKLQVQVTGQQQDGAKMLAEIDLIRAQTAQILASIGLDTRAQALDEFSEVAAQLEGVLGGGANADADDAAGGAGDSGDAVPAPAGGAPPDPGGGAGAPPAAPPTMPMPMPPGGSGGMS
jgi:hypothetical protein